MEKIERKQILVPAIKGYIAAQTGKSLHKGRYHHFVHDNFVKGHREFVRWGAEVIEKRKWGQVTARAGRCSFHTPWSSMT